MTQASLVASNTIGAAPFAVHFDAAGTVDTTVGDTFRELRYDFNFGDSLSGVWATSGASKNTESGGPLAAHVYDTPGVYTVTLQVGDDTKEQIITVLDPDNTWAWGDTVCLSTGTDFTGAPLGATLISNITAWPSFESGKRYMLRGGDDFTSLGGIITSQVHGMRIDSFGSGNKPIVTTLQVQAVWGGYPDIAPSDWSSNVQVIGLSAFSISHNITGSDILFYQNTINSGLQNSGIWFSHGIDHYKGINKYPNSLVMPKNLFMVENTSTVGALGDNVGQGQMIWMGNEISHTKTHNVRLWHSYKTVFSHNKLGGYAGVNPRTNLKMHSAGFDDVLVDTVLPPSYRPYTQYVVISNNVLNGASSTSVWITLAVKPQDTIEQEGVQDIIMERNAHINGIGGTGAGAFAGRNITTRGETSLNGVGQPLVGYHQESLPVAWQGPYFIDVPMPPAPDGSATPPVECPEGFELVGGECVEIPPIEPPIDPPVDPCICVDGEKGDKGDTGAQGIQGVQGMQGVQGIQGLHGVDGAAAADDPEVQEMLAFYNYIKDYFTPT